MAHGKEQQLARRTCREKRDSVSRICGKDDGVPCRVDERLKALGNTVDPDLVFIIGNSILQAQTEASKWRWF
jgi:hypothetical protein